MFIATLKNGERLDFGGKCNSVDYASAKMVVFKNEKDEQFIVLAIIPVDNVLIIINETKEEIE